MKFISPIAVDLAKKSKDENAPIKERVLALAQLGTMAQNNHVVIDIPDVIFNTVKIALADEAKAMITGEKPEYIWRNGARIKVKK